MAAVRFLVKKRSEAGQSDDPVEVLLDQPFITLGRDKTCHLVLPQRAVSRSHARVSRDGTLFFVEDLGSAYGTQINGASLPKGEKRLLRVGDVIAIAQFDVTFDGPQENLPKDAHEKTAFAARAAVKGVMGGLSGSPESRPYFRVMNGPREGERIEIADAKEIVIGRDEDADITLKQDDLVSRRHAKVRRDWSGTHVEDLESRNGIRVNRRKTDRRTLKDQDELEIGSTRLLFLDPADVASNPRGHGLAEAEATREDREPTHPSAVEQLDSEGAAPEAQAPVLSEPEGAASPSVPEGTAPSPDASLSGMSEMSEMSEMSSGNSMEGSMDSSMDSSMVGDGGMGDGGSPLQNLLGNPKRLILLAVMGLCSLVALVLLVLLIAGV